MLKGAWVLPAMMLVALVVALLAPGAASAAGPDMFDPAKQKSYFQDLPGVVPQAQKEAEQAESEYKCTSDVGYVSGFRTELGYRWWDDVPRRIYHCKTKSGITYSGTEMPRTQWVPGLNPQDLPR